ISESVSQLPPALRCREDCRRTQWQEAAEIRRSADGAGRGSAEQARSLSPSPCPLPARRKRQIHTERKFPQQASLQAHSSLRNCCSAASLVARNDSYCLSIEPVVCSY